MGVLQGVDERSREYPGFDVVEPELEAGDDPEAAIATPEAPEQVGVFGLAGVGELAVGVVDPAASGRRDTEFETVDPAAPGWPDARSSRLPTAGSRKDVTTICPPRRKQ